MGNERIPQPPPTWSLRRESDNKRYAFWDSLADFSSSKMDDAVQFCLHQVGSMIGSSQGFWAGIVRVWNEVSAAEDPCKGWRNGAWAAMGHTTPTTSPQWMRDAARKFNSSGTRDLTASHRVLEQCGQFRTFALSKHMVDLNAYRQSEIYDYYNRQQGVVDRLWIMSPINRESESCFCFDRLEGQSEFDERDINVGAEALRGIKWFHRQLLMCHGLGVAEESLTPAERGMVRELLTGTSEKEIAGRLNISPASAHQYIVRVYRKFGVRKRSEFLSLWLKGRV